MSSSEIIDIFSEDGFVTGSMNRTDAERDNHTTKNVLVFVFNSAGKVFIQLRPMHKSHYPGLWDISACGGIESGETADDAAARETQEETLIKDIELTRVSTFLNVFCGEDGVERRRISSLYIGFSDKQPQTNEEVDEFKFWSPTRLREHVIAHPGLYVPSFVAELDMAVEAYSKQEN